MKEFQIKFYKTVYFIVFLISIWMGCQLIIIPIQNHWDWNALLRMLPAMTFGFLVSIFGISLMLYLGNTRVVIAEKELIIKRPFRIQRVKWTDVTKIRRIFALYSGYAYYIYVGKKHVWIQDMFENMGELLKLIEEKSGKKIKGEFSKDKN